MAIPLPVTQRPPPGRITGCSLTPNSADNPMPIEQTEFSFASRIKHLESQADVRQTYDRDIDLSLRELLEMAPEHWPDDPEESVALAARVLLLGQRWLQRAANRSRALEMCAEHCLHALQQDLPSLQHPAPEVILATFTAWRQCELVPREVLSSILVERSSDSVRQALVERVRHDRMRTAGEMGALLAILRKDSENSTPHGGRDHAVLLALAEAHHQRFDEALAWLAEENANDPVVLEVGAEIAERAGRFDEALERLRRAALLSPDLSRLREKAITIHLQRGALDQALQHLITLLAHTGDPTHWHAFLPLLAERDPTLASHATERMQQEAPGVHLQLLMADQRVDDVRRASEARTLTADTLWSVGDFLAEIDPRAAAQRYERAIRLLGSTARNRQEISALSRKIDAVRPLFASIGRTTKPRRIAREIIPLSPNATALRRELEQLFATSFA